MDGKADGHTFKDWTWSIWRHISCITESWLSRANLHGRKVCHTLRSRWTRGCPLQGCREAPAPRPSLPTMRCECPQYHGLRGPWSVLWSQRCEGGGHVPLVCWAGVKTNLSSWGEWGWVRSVATSHQSSSVIWEVGIPVSSNHVLLPFLL